MAIDPRGSNSGIPPLPPLISDVRVIWGGNPDLGGNWGGNEGNLGG